MSSIAQKVSLPVLLGMVVGGMVGAGIFSLPQRFGAVTGPVGAIIAWIIAASGMYFLARVFQFLAERKPDLDAGVFVYAKAGFGEFPGFLSAFGYWVSSCIGNVFYWVMIKSTLGQFFPIFGDGNTAFAILTASIGIWAFHFMILRGTQQAAFINSVVTVAKIVPILVFILILIFAFKLDLFNYNLYGGDLTSSVFDQVRATMLVTVFVFLGIEGASVYSRFAKERSHVGTATILGFLTVTAMMVLVTLLPYAIMPRADIAGLGRPSMPGVLEAVVGTWGAVFISVGVMVSVLGAYLAWSLICAEVMFAAAKLKTMPKVFATENAKKVPAAAVWATSIVVQFFVITTYFSQDAFNLMLDLTAAVSLVPLFLVAAYAFQLTKRGETYEKTPSDRTRDLVIAAVATAYTAFLIWAAGFELLVLSTILYTAGTPLFVWACREKGEKPFTRTVDWVILGAIILGAVIGIYWLASGQYVI
jgi:arginine:ornithine antiporter/lysine permease